MSFKLSQTVSNSHAVGPTSRGGPRELGTAKALLDALVENNRAWIWVMFGYESFQNATQYITGTFPVLVDGCRGASFVTFWCLP